ncbi:MAG: DUF1049 domain-containing protein [Acaryochloris sp. RU_4_1]|nr:DUF1049 domain-containing protein [Acaryochloris sp. RU_4_1]NJR54584.1 DUF1049 domain-containing protein [Acaryochloris sp. CRU_2_0]
MHLLVSLLFSLGIAIAAILSVQNATAVSLQLFGWQSVPMPLGILLAFALGVGLLTVAIAAPLWPQRRRTSRRKRYPDFEEAEFSDDQKY